MNDEWQVYLYKLRALYIQICLAAMYDMEQLDAQNEPPFPLTDKVCE